MVLILILMEDTLWEAKAFVIKVTLVVLILILLEDTL